MNEDTKSALAKIVEGQLALIDWAHGGPPPADKLRQSLERLHHDLTHVSAIDLLPGFRNKD
jgi:hypothetical protein